MDHLDYIRCVSKMSNKKEPSERETSEGDIAAS